MSGARKSWTYIDETERRALLLDDSDMCFYYLVRTSGGWSASDANSRIDDFKKPVTSSRAALRYKDEEIARFADDVAGLMRTQGFRRLIGNYGPAALVPMPTSSPKGSPGYDARLARLCEAVAGSAEGLYVMDVFDMKAGVTPSHAGGTRNASFLKDAMAIDTRGKALPKIVILVDDVITTGSHYVACRDLIYEESPESVVIGVFLALHRSDWVDYEALGIDTSKDGR